MAGKFRASSSFSREVCFAFKDLIFDNTTPSWQTLENFEFVKCVIVYECYYLKLPRESTLEAVIGYEFLGIQLIQ